MAGQECVASGERRVSNLSWRCVHDDRGMRPGRQYPNGTADAASRSLIPIPPRDPGKRRGLGREGIGDQRVEAPAAVGEDQSTAVACSRGGL